jgi:hypothetical protein
MALTPLQNSSLASFTMPPLAATFSTFAAQAAGSLSSYRPQKPRSSSKIDWDDQERFGKMSQIISKVAYELASSAEIETFNEGCKKSQTFWRTAKDIARNYYQMSKDPKSSAKTRRDDLARAHRLKEAMEQAREVSLADFFREGSSEKRTKARR